jgi:hypothetical protein
VETLLGATNFAHLAGHAPSKFEGKFASSLGLPSYEDREHDVRNWPIASICGSREHGRYRG